MKKYTYEKSDESETISIYLIYKDGEYILKAFLEEDDVIYLISLLENSRL